MFSLGWPEVLIILLAAVIIFGPKKIPELGSALGKTLKGFKEEMNKPEEEETQEEFDRDRS
ncbi:MAG: twin-arginine translocase TatA/TatE family subunit [Cyanobacteria bacterium CRU_2_1]|nr:twin-arginine translocase TatA/TatE family subunit [Cyanobacteria bacterium RU_5_0]NJR59947.1 twin-arginine translocase TatA/TatE family subunit [Cyanobacteria bacterium CRU_2_1]